MAGAGNQTAIEANNPEGTRQAMANPNPSPETRFQKGNKHGGKTSEQRRLEYEAAEMAASLRHKMLSVITEKIEDGEDITDYLRSDALKLFKDSEDRAHGTPVQSTDITTDGEKLEPTVTKIELVAVAPSGDQKD